MKMMMTSIGQMNNETAKALYKMAGRAADGFVSMGQVAAADRNVAWAKIVSNYLTTSKLPIPTAIAEQAAMHISMGEKAARMIQVTAPAADATIAQTARVTANATASVANATVSQAVKSVARCAAPITLAVFAIETSITIHKYSTGKIDIAEAKKRTAESAATNSGGLGGAIAGAAIGTAFFPGVGTAIGGLIGGVGGAIGSSKLVKWFTRRQS
ncbi:MAG TPA: hypothetical protein PLN96_14595 [Zoogloea sp.]|uniref:hypothetical protein n=1 Tax=Zoogloea sp. TaxID=49181 RepID=UPI002BB27DC9|nr:hypothetical protein [Zoogloea sp.]HMV18700.1 hypothetical protein [Rhodocyclaceae bacterium]HNB66028.1 hypothetical protein [Rhodocyclaceae bacterium]HNI49096.1 hypothetical protein [Zoogloea sp.]